MTKQNQNSSQRVISLSNYKMSKPVKRFAATIAGPARKTYIKLMMEAEITQAYQAKQKTKEQKEA